jgi:Gluconate 2-dehydrogenase subunit 3
MNRRSAVKNLAIATGGLISLPFWMTACRFTDKQDHFSSFTPAEQVTLAAIADTIIPAEAGGVGALSVGVDKFLQKIIDDCYEKPVQDRSNSWC